MILYIIKNQQIVNENLIGKKIFNAINKELPHFAFKAKLINSKRNFLFISNSIHKILEYNETLYLNFDSYIKHDDYQLLIANITTCTPKQNYYQAEYRITGKDGDEKWLLEQGHVFYSRNGKIKKIEGLFSDITKNKNSEKILQESEKRFQLLIESAPIGIFISFDSLISYANPVFQKIFEFSDYNKLIGSSFLNLVSHEDKENIRELLKKSQINTFEKNQIESTGIKEDGTPFPFQAFFTNILLHNYNATITFIIDITERKKYENDLITLNNKLNAIIELIPDPLFIINNEKTITHWNKAIENLTNVSKEKMIGKSSQNCSNVLYGYNSTMLIDLLFEDNIEINNTQLEFIKKEENKISGNFSGNISNRGFVYLWGVATHLSDKEGKYFGAIELIKDITELKGNETALKISENKARIILDSNEDIILLLTDDGIISDSNQSFASLKNLRRDDLIGKNILDYLSNESKTLYKEIIPSFLRKKTAIKQEINFYDTIFYSICIYPVKNEKGEKNNFVIYAQNITKLKNTEKALKDREEEYRNITESITDYLFNLSYSNDKVIFQFKNPGIEKILGYTAKEFYANPNLFLDIIYWEDKENVLSKIQNIVNFKLNITIEYRIVHKNGDILWISNSFILKNFNKNILSFNAVINNITLRKNYEFALQEAEERYRAVFDQSGLISNVYNLEETLIMQNSMAATILGGNSLDFINKKIEELHFSETARKIKSLFKKTLNSDSPVMEENEILFTTGKFWLKTVGHKLKNSNDEIIGIQLISQDITEKKEIDRKLLNIIVETEEKERIHFAQELHDGLGPIISAIKMYIQWLSRPDSKLSREEILKDTENLINEAGETVRELSFKLSPHILKNFGLIEALNAFTQKVNHSKNINIIFDYNFSNRFDDTIETVIYRILCECINNTIKHAHATEVEIRILKFISKIRITYVDNGQGFDLNKFSLTQSGNGLFNMKSRLQSINGVLDIYSKPGEGIKISINIKL